jgi:hypothetical protein
MVTVVAVNIKRNIGINMSSLSKVSGMKWNLVSCMCSLGFFCLCVCLRVLFSEIEGITFVVMWCKIKLNDCNDGTSCLSRTVNHSVWVGLCCVQSCSVEDL